MQVEERARSSSAEPPGSARRPRALHAAARDRRDRRPERREGRGARRRARQGAARFMEANVLDADAVEAAVAPRAPKAAADLRLLRGDRLGAAHV